MLNEKKRGLGKNSSKTFRFCYHDEEVLIFCDKLQLNQLDTV